MLTVLRYVCILLFKVKANTTTQERNMAEDQARENLKQAYKELWNETDTEKKFKARQKVLASHWRVFKITGRVDDLPHTADSGY